MFSFIAVKATFVSYTTHKCRSALNFTLDEQYPIKSATNCEAAPDIPKSFLVLGEDHRCEEEDKRDEHSCFKSLLTSKGSMEHLTVGKTYLVAGTYSGMYGDAYDNCHDSLEAINRPLIAKWDSKIEDNINKFVAKGNEHRC